MNSDPFYASNLGAVLFGIGIALLIECFRRPGQRSGLGWAEPSSSMSAAASYWSFSCSVTSWTCRPGAEIVLWVLVLILLGLNGLEWILVRLDSERRRARDF